MKRAFYLLTFSFISLISGNSQAVELTTNVTDKSVEKYLREIESELPVSFSSQIEKKVNVVFRDINKNKASSIVLYVPILTFFPSTVILAEYVPLGFFPIPIGSPVLCPDWSVKKVFIFAGTRQQV